jgi:hypothetical protein
MRSKEERKEEISVKCNTEAEMTEGKNRKKRVGIREIKNEVIKATKDMKR